MSRGPRSELLPLLGVLAIYLVLALPRSLGIVHYDPDVVENLDIVRHLERGDGFVSTFRTYFFGPEGFPQPPQLIRPILYPLLVWPLYALFPSVYALQLLGFAIGALNLVLLAGLVRTESPPAVAFGAAAVVASMWMFTRNHMLALPEPLSLTLPLLALWVAAPPQATRRSAPLLLGLLLGLLILAKPATLALVPVLVAYDLWRNPGHRRPLPLALIAAGLVLCWLPLLRLNLAHGLSPFYASAGAQFTVFEPLDLMWTGFERPSPSAVEFLAANWRRLVVAVVRNWRDNIETLITPGGLAYLLVFLGPALLLWRRRGIGRLHVAFLALAAVNFLAYSMKWSPTQPRRYLFLTIVLAVPPLVAAMHGLLGDLPLRTRRGRLGAFGAAIAVVCAAYAFNTLNDVRDVLARHLRGEEFRGGAFQEIETDPDFRRAIATAEPFLGAGDVVAASEPWIWGYLTGRPFVLLPTGVSREAFERFLRAYDVRLVALNFEHQPRDDENRAYPEWLIERPGVRRLRAGSYDLFLLPGDGEGVGSAPEPVEAVGEEARP